MTNSYKPRSRGGRSRFATSSGNKNSGGSRRRNSGGSSRTPRGRSGKGRFQSQKINPNKFINKTPIDQVIAPYVPIHKFVDFGFLDSIVINLNTKGYVTPTRIQDESIPHILAGRDVIGLADTGSGKTGAFVLPIIQKLLNQKEKQGVLIISPTRELALQIQDEFRSFSTRMNLYSVLCVGGMSIHQQVKGLRRNPEVVIGTPGRLKDLINQGYLKLENTATLVLDEADRMLDMGFLPDINYIIDRLPDARQSLCFSATITPPIAGLMDKMLFDPVTVSVRSSFTGEHIAQDIVRVNGSDAKYTELVKMLRKDEFDKVLVFTQMKHTAQKLSQALNKEGLKSEAIHGNKTQPQRQRALDAFKKGNVAILVATDVAARGLDIPNVSHVINFDQPNTHEEYVHRIGRTGRAGKKGQAYTFVE